MSAWTPNAAVTLIIAVAMIVERPWLAAATGLGFSLSELLFALVRKGQP